MEKTFRNLFNTCADEPKSFSIFVSLFGLEFTNTCRVVWDEPIRVAGSRWLNDGNVAFLFRNPCEVASIGLGPVIESSPRGCKVGSLR